MTFAELDPALRAKLEQLGMDAGSLWSEAFRDERGRDPEPEECDEEAEAAAERLARRARKLLGNDGIETDEQLLDEIRQIIQQKFVDFALDG
jgi:ATP:corrinoid adenosyltransferase